MYRVTCTVREVSVWGCFGQNQARWLNFPVRWTCNDAQTRAKARKFSRYTDPLRWPCLLSKLRKLRTTKPKENLSILWWCWYFANDLEPAGIQFIFWMAYLINGENQSDVKKIITSFFILSSNHSSLIFWFAFPLCLPLCLLSFKWWRWSGDNPFQNSF